MRGVIAGALAAAAVCGALALAVPAHAGVVNPDISVIGQPFVRWTDDAGDGARKRLVLDPGETEFLFDAALNPYARGTVVVAFGDEGAAVEEGYFTLTRGLPANLALKAGQYRVGFGKLNIQHPARPAVRRALSRARLPAGRRSVQRDRAAALRAVRRGLERGDAVARRAPGRHLPPAARVERGVETIPW